ncbi:ParB/RepB/Spo0J family partition protein [Zafaria sp. Z1313]|uniref:ParB/RepB/Spo0J family partition protein n=1 Tax=Zafaria sp. Z1313 TaxID=3423202 RepID=UPI003D301DE6
MFFTPGRSADDEAVQASNQSSTSRPSSKGGSRRPAIPDVLGTGRAAGRAATSPEGDDDAGAPTSLAPVGFDGGEAKSGLDLGASDVSAAPEPVASNGDLEEEAEAPVAASTGVAAAVREAGDSVDKDPAVSRETLVAVPGASYVEVPVGDIHPNRKQPRQVFDEEDMAELVHSIKEVGLLQPIVVRPSSEQGAEKYELVMGERRWRATQQAGLTAIPAIVRETSDIDLLRDALLENLHRSQLNPLEEAAAYQQLLQEFGCTQDELSERIGRSRPQISNTMRLMKLPALVQRRVAAGVLSAGHARALLALQDPADMERLAQRIVYEGLSVRATEEIVALSDSLRRPSRETKPRSSARHERLDYLATSLSDRLDTNVKITLGAKKGRVSIEFASVDDLNRIMSVIAPEGQS